MAISQAGPSPDKDAPSVVNGSTEYEAVENGSAPTLYIHKWSEPYRSGLILACTIFVGEAIIMVLLFILPPTAAWVHIVLDALMITALLVPTLYLFMIRPLVNEIAQHQRARNQLEHQNWTLIELTRAEQSQRQLAEALSDATEALNRSLDPDQVLDRILEQTQRVIPCTVVAVLLLSDDWIMVARYRGVEHDQPLMEGFPLHLFPRVLSVAASTSPLRIDDTELDSEWTLIPGLEWVRSFVLAPLVAEEHTLGFLTTLSDQPGSFPSDVTNFLVAFANYAAVAIQRAEAYRAERWARMTAETLSAASLELTQTLEQQAVLDLLLEYLHRLIPYDVGSVFLMESESRAVLGARTHFAETEIESVIPDKIDFLENPHFQTLMEHEHPVLVRNAVEASPWMPECARGLELSCVSIPISAGGRALGFCCLERREADAFALDAAQLAEAVVAQAAVAIQNAGLFQQVRAGHDRLQSLSRRLVEVQESERIHVARELHDEAGQMLASILLALKLLEDNAQDPLAVVDGVKEIRDIANTVQEDLSRLAMDLRPASLDYLGLVAALNAFVNKLADQVGIHVQFKAVGWSGSRLPAEIEISIYRIAQEALTNVVRHAHAKRVDLLLQKSRRSVLLMVEDDGIGFDPELPSAQLGLVGIRERCEMLDGKVIVESAPGKGTTLVVEIPCEDSSGGV